ncbi:MAG: ribbon-helix-helix protein, CopG family [Polyangiaceae bacterium]
MKERHPRAFRFTDEDIAILAKLRKLTGLSASAAVRIAIREALTARETKRSKK